VRSSVCENAVEFTTTAECVKVAIGDLKKIVESKHPREKQYRRKK
jgi:hypothetical protein